MNTSSTFPSGEIQRIKGCCISLPGNDIDTDRIIPARFLKCVNFEALGEQVFADDRKELNGFHPFDIPINKGAKILIVNDNFGCGSSREHAPQALMRWGIRGIIGQSFAEIFYGNCLALGIPCATIERRESDELVESVRNKPLTEWDFDLNKLEVSNNNISFKLSIDKGSLGMLINGSWDATSQLISQGEKIDKTIAKLPYLNDFF